MTTPAADTPDISQAQLDQEASLLNQKVMQEAANDGLHDVVQGVENQTSALIAQLLKPAFDLFAPNWGINDMQIKILADAYTPVLTKYFPDIDAGKIPPEFTAILVTIAIIGPKRNIPRVIEVKPEPAPEGGGDA